MTEKTMKWQKLAYAGAFAGHPSGKFEMTPQTFSEIERNYKREGLDVVFDFEHSTELSVAESPAKARGEAIASGWIRDVQARPDGLYGLVAWTDKAYSMIKNQEVRYISPAIRFGAKDKVTGEPIGAKLSSAALCQKPFLSALPPALASDPDNTAFLCSEISADEITKLTATPSYALSEDEYLPKFRSILKLHDLADSDQILDKLDRLEELTEQANGNVTATVEGINLSDYIAPLREFMNMPANTTLSDLLDAVAEMVDDNDDSQGVEMSDIPSVNTPEQTTQLPAPVITPKETEPVMETITLSEHTVKLSEAVTAAVANATAPITLQLRDAESVAARALSDKAEVEAKVLALTEQIATRDAAVASARVDEAFTSYKETKKLSDDDKEAMAITLSTKPELFEKLYPKLTPAQSVLLHKVTLTDTSPTTKSGAVKVIPEFAKILSDVKAKNPTLDYDAQFNMAYAEQTALMAG